MIGEALHQLDQTSLTGWQVCCTDSDSNGHQQYLPPQDVSLDLPDTHASMALYKPIDQQTGHIRALDKRTAATTLMLSRDHDS